MGSAGILRARSSRVTTIAAGIGATEELWDAHRTRRDASARESLILQHAPLVKHLAGKLAVGISPVIDLDDVISAGMVGLIKAVENYDPGRGVPFHSYALICIRGSMLDQLRSLDVISRSVRRKAREIEQAISKLQVELGRAPSDEEVAGCMGISEEEYRLRLGEVGPAMIHGESLLKSDDDDENQQDLLATVQDTSSPDPVSCAERQGLLEALAGAVSRLSDRERLLLALYYKEDLTMKEISQVMGVSESRVCQLHSRAVLRLRADLRLWQP